jgi:diaminopimelate decarboxylase
MDFIENDNRLLKCNVDLYGFHSTMPNIIQEYLDEVPNQSKDDPFYIVDMGELTRSYMTWTSLLPNVKPYYAIKCNPNPLMLEALSQLGCYFDCASEDEIQTVLDITSDPSRILFANPCKVPSHIRFAQQNNVNIMTFDCAEELHKIKLYHPTSKLILRLAVDDSKSVCKFNAKFGCHENEVESLVKLAKTLQLDLVGFSFHVGSGCSSAQVYYEAIWSCRKATNVATRNGMKISIIDLGGGFPGKQKAVGFEDIADRINAGLHDFFQEELANDLIEIIAEPGRYFAEKTHTLVVNVIGKKEIEVKGKKTFTYTLNDGIYGSFSCIYFDHSKPNLVPLNRRWDEPLYKSTVFGPTCDSMDKIGEDVLLPELFIGDWVYVKNFGAYTVASSSSFNGFKTKTFKYIFRGKN